VHRLHSSNRPDIYRDAGFSLTAEDFQKTITAENKIAILAETNGAVAAFCIVTIRPPTENPKMVPRKVAFMEDLCVRADCRKQGIGKLVFREAAARAKKLGAQSLELMAWSFNKPAIRFYEEAGMSPRSVIMETKL
jgi:diamine N-acetyltransferase